ncbi:MAG: response regulator [Alphaproteobacteria bacterium]|nr:response regulator [Alphaproteobacteria bacterium]
MSKLPQRNLANIVLVEDSLGDIEYIKSILKKHNILFNLHICRDGQEILDFLYKKGEYATAEQPDLILLDLNLPKIKGKEILEIINKDKTLSPLPISILSGSEFEEDIMQCYKHGAMFYMHKPFDINLFLEIINKIEGLMAQMAGESINIYRVKNKSIF